MIRTSLGKICPYCQHPFTTELYIAICETCNMPHHIECWRENRGCTIFGCKGSSFRKEKNHINVHACKKDTETMYGLATGIILQRKYKLIKVIGHSIYGFTYSVLDIRAGLKVIMKEYFPLYQASRSKGESSVVIKGEAQKHDFENGLKFFYKQAEKLKRFSEVSNIVKVKDYFMDNNTAYMVMNNVEGVTLDEYIKSHSGRISLALAKKIIFEIMNILEEAHNASIYHLNISIDSIIIDKKSQRVFLEFGPPKAQFNENEKMQQKFINSYHAPEIQLPGEGIRGTWTDVYSIAAILYFLITGLEPPAAKDRIIKENIILPRQINKEISIEEEKIIMKAMSTKSSARFRSIRVFKEALEKSAKIGTLQEKIAKTDDFNRKPVVQLPAHSNHSSQNENLTAGSHSKNLLLTGIMLGATVITVLGITLFQFIVNTTGEKAMEMVNGSQELLEGEKEQNDIRLNGEIGEQIIGDNNELDSEVGNQASDIVDTKPTTQPEVDTSNLKEGLLSIDGGTYTGHVLNGQPHGHGRWYRPDGSQYVGDWKNGLPNGHGEKIWDNGDWYSGYFANGLPNGYGTYIWANGLKYEGMMKNGFRHGKGTLIYPDGSTRDGVWQDNELVQ